MAELGAAAKAQREIILKASAAPARRDKAGARSCRACE
jgi:hypothetical protein